MALQKCLLVTDDPDDHQAFTDALTEISDNAVVVVILDSHKALSLLLEKTFIPDYIFLDLSMTGIRINTFLKTLKKEIGLESIPTVLYGDNQTFFDTGEYGELHYFKKEYEYSELKDLLKTCFTPSPPGLKN
jgi:DNA-binding NtrC family response regulator